jgi:integrase
MPKKLTQTVVDALVRRGLDGRFTPSRTLDDRVGGLVLAVGPRRAAWTVSYIPHGRTAAGKRLGRATMTIADATFISVHDARAKAQAIKLMVAEGRDPLREQRSAKAAAVAERHAKPETTDEAAKVYAGVMLAKRELTEKHRKQQIAYVGKAIRIMGVEARPVRDLDGTDIRALIDRMDGSPGERRHILGALDRFLRWLRKRDMIASNPCREIDDDERPRAVVRRDYVPSLAELRAIWRAANDAPDIVRDLVHFMLLTPLRRGEAAGLRWNEIDFDAGWIRIPGARMKNRLRHELPLSQPALEIVKRRRGQGAVKPDALVFPSQAGTALDNWSRTLRRIRQEIGQAEAARSDRFNFHDIRRGFVTCLAEHFDEALLDRILAHSRGGVAGTYQHARYMKARPRVMETWASILLDGEHTENVVKLHVGMLS